MKFVKFYIYFIIIIYYYNPVIVFIKTNKMDKHKHKYYKLIIKNTKTFKMNSNKSISFKTPNNLKKKTAKP